MIIRKVSLVNFRSHERFVLGLSEQTTTLVGENGCGKTSVLEAIYEAMRGKSFRAVDREILRRGAEFYRVELEYEDGRKMVVVYDGNKKSFMFEDMKSARIPKKAKYPIVLFEPEDLHLVGASPTSKRDYFDRMFGQLDEQYGVALTRYGRALRQRNELLKDEFVQPEQVFPWDKILATYGSYLAARRREMMAQINSRMTDVYRSIAENGDEVELSYVTEVGGEEAFLARLQADFRRDSLLGHTTFGAHKDQYEFVFNGRKADGSASRGEVRSSVLALKFIEADLVTRVLGRRPVVLLDDVFSELDATRQGCLVKNFQENQVVLTSVGEGRLS